nr:type VI secretion system tip protein TssI/VgrG [Pantoea dispersa]
MCIRDRARGTAVCRSRAVSYTHLDVYKRQVYDWPVHFVDHSHGEFYTRIRQEVWQVAHHRVSGTGTATGIAPGYRFGIVNAPHFSDNGEFLVSSARYDYEENEYASGGGGARHNIAFTVLPSSVTYRAEPATAWPKTHGPQTAKVVGPAGESIWTDRYGRVKVKFHWDRLAKGDDTSSCWVRVSSAWAGQGYGSVQIPRVGDEVVVDFINGDPDRPIVTGRVYNDGNMPPWALPAAATQMGFYSRSKGGHRDTANALRFEDKAGHEQIWIHAEKNMDTEVESCETHHVGMDRHKTIGRDEKVSIKRNRQADVGEHALSNTGVQHVINVGEGETVLTMDKEGNALLEANTSIKLKVKENYLLITPDAIQIQVNTGNIHAESELQALFKGNELTTLGTGKDAELKANDTVSITGTNITDIKSAVVKINS